MRKILAITALTLIVSYLGYAQETLDKAKLDTYFQAIEDSGRFMGSVAVSQNGELIYTNSIGFLDVEENIPATKDTKYRIGSISKTFTAVLILKAVEEKKLSLDQTLEKWFPTIENGEIITISQLLGHRSGIHNFTDDPNYLTYNTQSKTEEEMIEIITSGGSDFKPDSTASYSNSNYVLLSYILEKVYQLPYADILKKKILEPLKLDDTYVFSAINTIANESRSYKFMGMWVEEAETDFSIPLGAGAITSTPSDLTRFASALFDGKLLSDESLEMMTTLNEEYGKGLFRIPFYGREGYGHTGGIDGFSSVFSHFQEENISYALISNGSAMNMNDISIAVLSAVYNVPYEIPTFSNYKVTSADLDVYLGVYASKQIALKITITKEGSTLFAQGTGQPSFPLEAVEKDKFKADQVGAKIDFDLTKNTMTLFQGGGQIIFTKE